MPFSLVLLPACEHVRCAYSKQCAQQTPNHQNPLSSYITHVLYSLSIDTLGAAVVARYSESVQGRLLPIECA